MWELDCEESWALKNWCFWTVVLKKTLESPLDCKEIQPVHPKGDQSWMFIGRTDAEGETPILWPPHVKSWLIGKDHVLGGIRDRRRRGRQRMRWLMASLTRWTWVWVNSWSWWWTGRPGVLRFMGSQRVGHDWVTELNWTEPPNSSLPFFFFFYWNPLCLNSESLLGWNLVPLYLFLNFSYKGHQRLLSSSFWLILLSVWFFKFHPLSDQWHNFIILMVLFHGWVMVHCL